jgi:hypothetical protein
MTEMTCRQFDEVVHGFVRMELLDVRVREAVLEHAARCKLCAQRMADATALAEASELLGRSSILEQTPQSVESALRAEFRNHHRRKSWRRTVEWLSVGAAAAILIIFLWTVKGRSKGSSSLTAEKVGSAQSAARSGDGVMVPPTKEDESAVADSALSSTAETGTYAASDFVPVPFTSAITADDPGMVVRVQLTRASLAQLGYPVAEAPDEDLILADVLVGEDGWPRGVKLIQ